MTTNRWDDDKLDRFAESVKEFQAESRASMVESRANMAQLINRIDRLVEALYVEFPRIRADINAIHDETASTNETAKIQAESVRELIRLLNQKQA
jgi:hypothetical protein